MVEPLAVAREELRDFVGRIRDGRSMPDFFDGDVRVTAARAPGRLDVMGGIADYSGSLVLELPIRQATFVALQPATDGIRIVSRLPGPGSHLEWLLDRRNWRELLASGADGMRAFFAARPADSWAAYVVGIVHTFARAFDIDVTGGLRILIESDVPVGKGLSSSAAIEVAAARALTASCGLGIELDTFAGLCQKAENHVVGAPCGIMDPVTSAGGMADRLLALRCQPSRIEGHVAVPAEFAFFGIDSGIRHAVSGADYGDVRTAAFMGYRIIADHAGLQARTTGPGRVTVDDAIWRGYLANLAPDRFHAEFARVVPERLGGAEFLRRWHGITDTVTHVDAAREYGVFPATRHPIEENVRVEAFRTLLQAGDSTAGPELGRLMYESHRSYSDCGLGSDGTDRIVEIARQIGGDEGIFGAKITGGGSGGTVAVLAAADARSVVIEIARRYTELTGRDAEVFEGSSPGAMHVPCESMDIR